MFENTRLISCVENDISLVRPLVRSNTQNESVVSAKWWF